MSGGQDEANESNNEATVLEQELVGLNRKAILTTDEHQRRAELREVLGVV